MATQTNMKPLSVLVRISQIERDLLWKILFCRYPDKEWGTFIRVGWRETPHRLILTVNFVDQPEVGDLDEESYITVIQSQYTKRMLRVSETHEFGLGFVHSHPEEYFTYPSESDIDMEAYYADLLKGYTPNRPFVSLIFSRLDGIFSGSGRVWWKNAWLEVDRFAIENCDVRLKNFDKSVNLSKNSLKRMSRFVSQFSLESAEALAGAVVGVVGLSGTGSPIVELLTRAGVGKLILVDPKVFEDSNFERNHFSKNEDIGTEVPKALMAKRYVESLNPNCEIIALQGRLPQREVVDYLLECDIILGCSDQHSARMALTEMSTRFLMPVIDVGVVMEGDHGNITGQVIQINKLFPGDACVICRDMVSQRVAGQELMTEEEKQRRQSEAINAKANGGDPNAYWVDVPQLNTVGYLTTTAGGLVSGYCIGYLTGRFSMAKNRIEVNLGSDGITIVEKKEVAKASCNCKKLLGCADQDNSAILISPPLHWSDVVNFSE